MDNPPPMQRPDKTRERLRSRRSVLDEAQLVRCNIDVGGLWSPGRSSPVVQTMALALQVRTLTSIKQQLVV